MAPVRAPETGAIPIGQYRLATETDRAYPMIGRAASLVDAGRSFCNVVARAECFASHLFRRAVLAATESHGGYVLAEARHVGYFAACVNTPRARDGAANVQHMLIAEAALDHGDADRHPVPPRCPLMEGA